MRGGIAALVAPLRYEKQPRFVQNSTTVVMTATVTMRPTTMPAIVPVLRLDLQLHLHC